MKLYKKYWKIVFTNKIFQVIVTSMKEKKDKLKIKNKVY